VRRIDLVELLADLGLGGRMHSIIGTSRPGMKKRWCSGYCAARSPRTSKPELSVPSALIWRSWISHSAAASET
jgi:hypothetical protein